MPKEYEAMKVATKIGNADDSIRNGTTETAVLLDAKGNEIGRTSDGEQGSVTITPELKAQMRDAIMTHNHPMGTTFSPEDVYNAIINGLQELRATTANNGTYVLRRAFDWMDGNHSDMKYIDWYKEYATASGRIRSVVQSRIYRGEITSQQEAMAEDSRLRGEWLTENAPRYGWKYTKER